MIKLKKFTLPFAVGLSLISQVALSEDRALLIGVGDYQNGSSGDLPGIDLDIKAMQRVVKLLGYQDHQVKTLMDSQATLANTVRYIDEWLIRGASKSDRVLLYFSGHGSYVVDENGDEREDGRDEVLVMHDYKVTQNNGQSILSGVLVDDLLGQLLDRMPSQNVLVLIDACHSGTSTRSLTLTSSSNLRSFEGTEKFLHYEGLDLKDSPNTKSLPNNFTTQLVTEVSKGRSNHVAIAAAGDNEQAIATNRGSVFTEGLLKTVHNAYRNNDNLTADTLYQSTHRFVSSEMNGTGKEFYPVLTPKNSPLANKPLFLAQQGSQPTQSTQNAQSSQDSQNQSNWQSLSDLANKLPPFRMTLNQDTFRNGDELEVSVTLPSGGGYLNIVSVDSQDNATVLFPNQFNRDNYVKNGILKLPTPEMNFLLRAGPPFGRTLTVAFLTQKKVNFYESGNGQKDAVGNFVNVFPTLNQNSFRAFSAEAKKQEKAYGAYVETRVDP